MNFNEIIKEVKDITFETLRIDQNNYFEAVVVRTELERLKEKLDRFFGEAISFSQDGITPRVQEAVKGFGGIRDGQTLYFWDKGPEIIFAMLWPWQDGFHTTLKISKR